MLGKDERPTKPLASADLGRLVLRLAVGGLMLLHGIHKVQNGIGGIEDMLADKGLPEAIAYGVYVGEILAPVLVVVGLFGRLGALIMVFNMAMSMWLAFGEGTFAINEHGALATEVNWLYLAGALAIFFLGSGRISLRAGKGAWD